MALQEWALVTGASQGIGRAMAAEAARRGMNVCLVALPGTGLPTAAEELAHLYEVETECWECDLADRTAVEELVAFISASGWTVSLLVNNAGVGGAAPVVAQEPTLLESMIDLNVRALSLLTRHMLPHLLAQEQARILNVASLAGWYPLPGMSVYAATKAYVISFSLALREELRGSRVTVSLLCPSGVVTKEEVVKALCTQGFLGRATSRYPDQLARYAVPRALRGRRLLVPGVMNKLLRVGGRLAPLRWVCRVGAARFA